MFIIEAIGTFIFEFVIDGIGALFGKKKKQRK